MQASAITNLRSAATAVCQEPPERRQRGEQGRTSPTERYSLVSAVSYSLSRSSSKMSTSTLAFPARSGARLMRFLARVMESRSPLLHSIGSSRMAAAGAKGMAEVRLRGTSHTPKPRPCAPRALQRRASSRRSGVAAPASATSLPHPAFHGASPTSRPCQTWGRPNLCSSGRVTCRHAAAAHAAQLRVVPAPVAPTRSGCSRSGTPGCAAPGSTDQGTAPHPEAPIMK